MRKVTLVLITTLLGTLSSCNGADCSQLPKKYSSYEQAVKAIKTAGFKIKESVNTSKSSWIRGASFYSCDGSSGYFLLVTDKKDYLYKGIPIRVWEEFKNAESFGSYYNKFIRDKYKFDMN